MFDVVIDYNLKLTMQNVVRTFNALVASMEEHDPGSTDFSDWQDLAMEIEELNGYLK